MTSAGADPLFSPEMRAADQGGVDGGCPDDGADRLSDLPDHLLHRILCRLRDVAAAARTSALSRRWRRVWLQLPELVLRYGGRRDPASPSPCPRVDAALAACAAPLLNRLEIDLTRSDKSHVTAEHVSSWLDFASRRLDGELLLSLPFRSRSVKQDVVLPICERLTAISLSSLNHALRFRTLLPAAVGGGGTFAALATLTIDDARVDGRELEDVVSSRCPRLKELALDHIILEDRDHPVLSVRSASLERLRVRIMFDDDRLQVATPELRALDLPAGISCAAAHIAAPKLSEVRWGRLFYDPSRHHLEEAGRHLRRLEVAANSRAAALMDRFDTADELTLNISVSKGVDEYERFLEDTKNVAKCEVLVVRFREMAHHFQPILLHLLRKCSGIRKLVVGLWGLGPVMGDYYPCELQSCPCGLLKNHDPTYGIDVLDSLQEVEVEQGGYARHKLELARLLCGCRAIFQKKVFITIPVDKRDLCTRRKIDRLFLPNDDITEVTIVEFTIH